MRVRLPRLGGLHLPRLRGLRLPRGRGRVVAAVVVGAVVVAAVVVPWTLSGANASQNNTVVILAKVQPRTLQDTVQLTGTLARKSLSTVTTFAAGLVTSVYATDGQTETAGQPLFALNGRDAVAEPGTIPFFRSLALGDTGPDVLELKQILAAAGDYPGSLTDDQFTEQTQFALAQWQGQHHYPNATPATTETVNVALQQGSGYQIGAQASAGLTIGPPAQTSAAHTGAASTDELLAYPHVTTPTITIQSVADQVPQGEPADFVVTATPAPSADLVVNLDFGGTAGSNDIITPPSTVTILSGTTSAEVAVDTRVNTTVEADPPSPPRSPRAPGTTWGRRARPAPPSPTTTRPSSRSPGAPRCHPAGRPPSPSPPARHPSRPPRCCSRSEAAPRLALTTPRPTPWSPCPPAPRRPPSP